MCCHLEGRKSPPTVVLKCPKCNAEIVHTLSGDDFREISTLGVARIGFLHGDHVLILCFDSTGFVRGAYIVAPDKVSPDMRIFYGGFKVVLVPKISASDVELAVVDFDSKTIDLRASNLQADDVKFLMEYIESYRPLIRLSPRRIGIAGRSYLICECNNTVILYNNVQPEVIKQIFSNMPASNRDLALILLSIRYANSSKLDRDSPEFKERLNVLINANRVKIRARKEVNAMKFARASIMALWPDLAKIFDAIVSYVDARKDEEILLMELLSKYPDTNFDDLYGMLRELMKRDLIEIINGESQFMA